MTVETSDRTSGNLSEYYKKKLLEDCRKVLKGLKEQFETTGEKLSDDCRKPLRGLQEMTILLSP